MNIDVRQYLRINPISSYQRTLSNNPNDCFVWFNNDDYNIQTQKQVFLELCHTIFVDLIEWENEEAQTLKLAYECFTNGTFEWSELINLSDTQFANYVRRKEWNKYKEDLETKVSQLLLNINNKINELKNNNNQLNYVGAVELMSRNIKNIYDKFGYAIGGIWCLKEGGTNKSGSDRATISQPISHTHNNTLAETTSIPFGTAEAGGNLVGEFKVSTQQMVGVNTFSQNSIVVSAFSGSKSAEQTDDIRTYPLWGENMIDFRNPSRTHNNIPPSLNIYIRFFSSRMQSRDIQQPISMTDMMSRSSSYVMEAQYQSSTVKSLQNYFYEDLTDNDYLLRVCQESDDTVEIYKQTMKDMLYIFAQWVCQELMVKIDGELYSMEEILEPKLTEQLVPRNEFLGWVSQIQDKLAEAKEGIQTIIDLAAEMPPKTYVGRIIISTTDDIESKVIEHYGGKAWKRVTNFLRGVEHLDDELGEKLGENYVCLRESNVPNHTHKETMTEDDLSNKKWVKCNVGGSTTKILNQQAGSYNTVDGIKKSSVEFQLSPLEYYAINRITIPHNNIPPYRAVYIWECVDGDNYDGISTYESYNIIYNMNGHGEQPDDAWTIYTSQDSLPYTPPDASTDGYTFKGWTPTQIPSGTTGSFTFKADWDVIHYSVKFNMNGFGETPDNAISSYTIESPDYTPNDPVHAEGKTFFGWNPGSIPTGSFGDVVFNAMWTTWTYTVTFINGDNVQQRIIEYNCKVGTLPNPTKEGYTLDGWYTEPSGGTLVTENTRIKDDFTCYSHWNPITYTITYNLNGHGIRPSGLPTEYTIESETITPTDVANVTGYTFNGWYPSNITHGSIGNKTFTARWTTNTMVVTYNSNGGTISRTSDSILYDHTISSLPTGTKNEYTLNGWWTSPTGGTRLTTSTPITSNITYYAHWSANAYTITYDMNGHGTNPSSNPTAYNIESATITPTRPSDVPGYTFTGWTPANIPHGSTGNKTFTAGWDIATYSITYDMKGQGSNPNTETSYTYGEEFTPSDPDETNGYTFNGWTPAKITSTTYGAIKFISNWRRKSFNITYNMNEHGTNPNTKSSYYYGDTFTPATPSAVTGYTFKGWIPSQVTCATFGDIEFTATWSLEKYPITYDMKGHGTNPSTNPTEYTYGRTITPICPDDADGYKCTEWSPEKITTDTIGPVTFSAVWYPIVYTMWDDGNNKHAFNISYTHANSCGTGNVAIPLVPYFHADTHGYNLIGKLRRFLKVIWTSRGTMRTGNRPILGIAYPASSISLCDQGFKRVTIGDEIEGYSSNNDEPAGETEWFDLKDYKTSDGNTKLCLDESTGLIYVTHNSGYGFKQSNQEVFVAILSGYKKSSSFYYNGVQFLTSDRITGSNYHIVPA